MQQGISEPIFYGDLVYKLKRIVVKPNVSDQFKKVIKPYNEVGYNLDVMQQSACLVLNPICGLVPDACLLLGPTWLNDRFSLALTICES